MSETLSPTAPLPRQLADAYVDAYVELDPVQGTSLGIDSCHGRLPDFSPEGREAIAALQRTTLARLAQAESQPGAGTPAERRCAGLLRERLDAQLALYEAHEHLRAVTNLGSPAHTVRLAFSLMPTADADDWAVVAQRLRAVPEALEGYRASLAAGLERRLPGGPRQVAAMVAQLGEWSAGGGWFSVFAADGPAALRAELTAAARLADAAVDRLRGWLREVYGPGVEDGADVVGRERYVRGARYWNGTDLDLEDAYAYGWAEFHRLHAEMRAEAKKVLPGAATPWEALGHLAVHGPAVDGVEATRAWLQALMDEAVLALDGTHFDLAARVRRVESMIAPPGTAAAPYYTGPSLDFTRPGRTWLPTLGRTRFPVHELVSVWYHEGVPGHHLQLAQWAHVADGLSRYQTTLGLVSANVEGWALYAERLMDELGFLTDPARRLGYLDEQMLRAIRVIIDIGMHLELRVPGHAPLGAGERWTPALGREFFARHSGLPRGYLDSELVRYLGKPGQAIGYKLGERVWLAGREAARAARGAAFDAKAWHMAALSQGSLGLDELGRELALL
ncbi:DUF885 domain-containing protein [Streptomyces sp. JJ66]|uniref:DUF885 domain-containing protein n=1 Tax=Streptomyces sp. JJ66 TaxID=2803843 RepID=UPI001C55DB4A|nr:DUF885 domain-containing protein [Streptomyces sp. JJ66]MBW1603305.1 DUF885 domain-containing protein [Streptomyces sp. JJ66]